MVISITNALAISVCDTVVDACDVGSTDPNATLVIYDGTPPANADTALSGNNVLAELEMSNPAFGAAVDAAPNATATASAITDDSSANATGTASFFRILDRDNNVVLQGSVATSGAELNLNTVSITAGDPVEITSLTITMPEA